VSLVSAQVGTTPRVQESRTISRDSILAEMKQRRDHKTDRVVVGIQVAQLICAIVLVAVYSPPHAMAALATGGALTAASFAVFAWRPTRHAVAVGQAVWSLLLISMSGGRFDSHLHVFASLAILSLYCDWRVVFTATMCMGLVLFETSAFDQLWWLIFEAVILAFGCRRHALDLEDAAIREATLQLTAVTIERKVENRTRALKVGAERYRALVENTEAIPFEFDAAAHRVLYMAPQAARMFDCSEEELHGVGFFAGLLHPEDAARVQLAIQEFVGLPAEPLDYRLITSTQRVIHARTFFSSRVDNRIRGVTLDVTRQTILEAGLRQAQKLESVGRLAAGVAHELNTPIQFVGDSLTFTRDAVASLFTVIEALRVSPETAERAIDEADLPFLKQELPTAIDRALEGAQRVAVIVRSMKAFSHPGKSGMGEYDLKHAVESTLAIARNEYKYVADVKLELEAVAPVWCCAGEINRAILNVVVNAAHAIAEVVEGTPNRGTLTVSLRSDATHAIISIGDTGTGIPDDVRDRIFDQFFTTKALGKGTGQGLSLARAVIVDEHGGSITFDTGSGGTTFHLRIPIQPTVALAA
jgi:signal transduction histidine kinase